MSDQADCVATRAVPPTIWYDFLPYLDIYLDTTFSAISTELLFFLQQNLIEWYIIFSWSALCKTLVSPKE